MQHSAGAEQCPERQSAIDQPRAIDPGDDGLTMADFVDLSTGKHAALWNNNADVIIARSQQAPGHAGKPQWGKAPARHGRPGDPWATLAGSRGLCQFQ